MEKVYFVFFKIDKKDLQCMIIEDEEELNLLKKLRNYEAESGCCGTNQCWKCQRNDPIVDYSHFIEISKLDYLKHKTLFDCFGNSFEIEKDKDNILEYINEELYSDNEFSIDEEKSNDESD